ncbi:hypothetical protein V8F06_008721, partial [Rhypophila decipiens]
MFRISVLVAAFWAVWVLALNTPSGLQAPIQGYEVSEITWEVDVFNNGMLYNLTGTVEQVHEHVSKINPNFVFPAKPADAPEDWSVRCGGGTFKWPPARPGRIDEGIDYLSKVPGQPRAGPGLGACARVSCSYESAIWWCNNNLDDIALPGFGTIADCAKMINNDCKYGWDWVLGQNFVS